jgi:hypothetical protein
MVTLGQFCFRSGYLQSSRLSLLKEGDGVKTCFAGQAQGLSDALTQILYRVGIDLSKLELLPPLG